jgi:hypothetical protein
MACPIYQDFTRACVEKYPALVIYKDFTECESDAYQKCIIYQILQSDFHCKHLDSCLMMFHEKTPEFLRLAIKDPTIYDFLTSRVYDYCLAKDNTARCARYKMKEEGNEPPPGLSPDGINVDIPESTAKQEIASKERLQAVS